MPRARLHGPPHPNPTPPSALGALHRVPEPAQRLPQAVVDPLALDVPGVQFDGEPGAARLVAGLDVQPPAASTCSRPL
ncbi:hypothetical protein [Streptomyces sp. NPDC088254]|uniref:hypothetical protein n=1 Tax=Streptomyces sp. NPDC088254 TaxID=3365847 RepID=UPI003803A3B9